MPQSTTTITSAGIDWLTISAPNDERGLTLRELGVQALIDQAAKGNRVHPFHRGIYYGGTCGGVGVGEHKDRTLLEITGGLADLWAPALLPLAEKISRIDVQVSVRQEPYDHMLALRAWAKSILRARQEGRQPDYDLYARRTKGSTLYIGEGASRFRARLYERWYKEQVPENENVWRYEVQARRERARQVGSLLPKGASALPWAKGYVHSHFARRGVEPIFDGGTAVSLPPLVEGVSDREKTLEWLAQSVRPALSRLEGWGALDQALRVLGVQTNVGHDE